MGANLLFYVATPITDVFPPVAPWTETFTGDNGSKPNDMYWDGISDYDQVTIQNNKCNFDSVDGTAYWTQVETKFALSGDFDAQLDFEHHTFGLGSPGNSQYAPLIYINRADNDAVVGWVGRVRTNTSINGYGSDGHIVGVTAYADADASGGLRVTRVGNGFYVYVWTGTQWVWNGNTSGRLVGSLVGVEVYLKLAWGNAVGNIVDCSIDDFTINSGTPVAR